MPFKSTDEISLNKNFTNYLNVLLACLKEEVQNEERINLAQKGFSEKEPNKVSSTGKYIEFVNDESG